MAILTNLTYIQARALSEPKRVWIDGNGAVTVYTGSDAIDSVSIDNKKGPVSALEFSTWNGDTTRMLQEFINYCANNAVNGYIPKGLYTVSRLYGKYDGVNNPNGSSTPHNFRLYGAGRLGDKSNLTQARPDRTVIKFTDTVGDLFDFSTEGSPWSMRNIELFDMSLVGATSGYVLNSSGSFRCAFHRLGIHNFHANGGGWKLQNFDQVNVDDIYIQGPLSGKSTGKAFDFRSQDTAIDGSLSVFNKLLAQNFAVAYQFGEERDSGVNGNFQSFNTFNSIGCLDCDTAMILGDRWHNNVFNAPQLRGDKHGLILTGRSSNNVITAGTIQCMSESDAVTALYIGYGSTVASKETTGNILRGCTIQTNRRAAPPVIWNNDAASSLVSRNVLEDCTFESVNTTQNATNGILFTSSGNSHIQTGAVIRPTFKRVNIPFSFQGDMINVINPDVSRTLYGNITTTGSTPTTLRGFRPANNKVISIDAHVLASDAANPATANHASYKIQALAYNNNGVATLIGAPVISVIEANASMDCSVDVSGVELRLRVTGLPGVTINWHAVINVMVTV